MLPSSRAISLGLELVLGALFVGCTPSARESSSTTGLRDDAASQAESPGSDTQPTPQNNPDHLGIEPEVLVSLAGGGQVYGHLATNQWFYLAGVLGVVAGGTGIFRMPKEPGVIPELISEDWSGSTAASFHFDGEYVYFLDDKKLSRWKEDLSDWTKVELERSHYHVSGDADTVFAMGDNCEYLTLFDKQTLKPTTYVPERTEGRGGSFDITSNGSTIYCTGRGVLYSLDKASGELQRTPITWGGDPASPTAKVALQFKGFFFDEGRLNGNSKDSDYWGYIDVESGVFTPVNRGGWNAVNIGFDRRTGLVYLAENLRASSIWRYNRNTESGVRIMAPTLTITTPRALAMDAGYIYFVTIDDPIQVGESIGIMRVRKPSAD